MIYVYILKCLKTGEYYKGLTSNIENRLVEHLEGKVTFTKNRLPVKLIHVEICSDRKAARKLEKYFKSGYGRENILEIDNQI